MKKPTNPKYIFINKTVFFPEEGILAVGDLHLGYDVMLKKSGILIPNNFIKETIEELDKIFKEIENQNLKLKKVVFLGDIKHSFSYEWEEKHNIYKVFDFIQKKVSEKNIIITKGNHDTIDFLKNLKDYYIEKDIAFLHGDKDFLEVYDTKIKYVVLGHLHPSVMLQDPKGIKKEEYKCFLTGKYKNKEFIVLPSFLSLIEGTRVNNLDHEYEDYFSIIPKKNLRTFNLHVVGDNRVYPFGKIKDL